MHIGFPWIGYSQLDVARIGFSINEILFLIMVASGLVWIVLRVRLARRPTTSAWTLVSLGLGAQLFAVAALVCTTRVALADWPRVPTGSMEPTLRVGDFLLVNHLAYGPRLPFTNTAIETGRPKRGDVVVFRYPLDVSQFYVKRLMALPGDHVEFRDGTLSVDHEPFEIERLDDGMHAEDRGQWLMRETVGGASHEMKINPFVQGRMPALNMRAAGVAENCVVERAGAWNCTVPPGHYLMLGDNRDASADFRVWGFLPEREVYGKAVRVLFNLADMRRAWTPL